MKRSLDIFLSLLALICLSPMLLLVSFILRLTGEGEIFYVQERVGLGGKIFGLVKFASMLKNSSNMGTGDITIKGDPRVLPFGRFLRKTKINELPQLWNVFIGDMSLVGPRPMVPKTYSFYGEESQAKLNKIKPGLTGIGSIVFRDEERFLADLENPIEFYKEHIIPFKIKLELWFLTNDSLWLYVKIIFATAWIILFPSSKIVNKLFTGIPEVPASLT